MIKRIINSIVFFFRLYIVVYALTMLASIVFMFAFDSSYLSRRFMVNTVLFCILALIPTIPLFIIPEQFVDEYRWPLQIFMLIFNEATLMPFGYHINMWNQLPSGILMAVIILVINLSTPLIVLGKDYLLASSLNHKFTELNKNED